MNDVLPTEMARWSFVESAFVRIMQRAGYRELRTPYVEPTALFVRSVGETTDMVEKEMYSFRHGDEELTLRPEGTASAARAYIEHNVANLEPVTKWFYLGPMFRAERPQRGRYRQFYQLGAEVFGDAGPGVDAELIELFMTLVATLGIHDARVHLSTLGGASTRQRYRDALLAYLSPKRSELSEESQRRLERNPLRILDSKDPRDRAAIVGAPSLLEFVDADDREHFECVKAHLDALGIAYVVDERLVRGLDYYSRTLFEIKGAKDKLGAGDTLMGGGRYDGMLTELGGSDVPAIGFAAGLERLLIAMGDVAPEASPRVFLAGLGSPAMSPLLVLGRDLRARGVEAISDTRGNSLKSQLRRANALGARFACILGESELQNGVVVVKDLAQQTQESLPRAEVVEWIANRVERGAT
jgi:histidyl-tRNA synthetase